MTSDVLRWVAADSFVSAPVGSAPSILRFASDDFMERMLQLLSERPQDLPQLRANPEAWRAPGPVTPKLADPNTDRRPLSARALARRTSLRGFQRQTAPLADVASEPPLKLFQPVHQRFYLAAAHLVCERPGLPPRVLQGRDRSGFVIRRVFANETGDLVEHGFVKGADGRGVWVPITNAAQELATGENLLPVFPLGYSPPHGPTRVLSAGLIPASQHDDYVFAARVAEPPAASTGVLAGPSVADQLKTLALTKIITPWQALLSTANAAIAAAKPQRPPEDTPWSDESPPAAGIERRLIEVNMALVEASWRLLQEFREWLQEALPEVAAALAEGIPSGPEAQALLAILEHTQWEPAVKTSMGELISKIPPFASSLRCALVSIGVAPNPLSTSAPSRWFELLDDKEKSFAGKEDPSWPDFVFPLVIASYDSKATAPPSRKWPLNRTGSAAQELEELLPPVGEESSWRALKQSHHPRLVRLLRAIYEAVDEAASAGKLPVSCAQASSAAPLARALSAQLKADPGPARFVLRFVHVRCDCGPLAPPVLSAPSAVFQLAGFFDPDAPLRPLRIALPFDITPGGLRKYTKNSAFIVSDLLCGQMKRVRALGLGDLVLSVLPWPFYKKLRLSDEGPCAAPDRFGMICSLSIPIITLVAFVLLIVMAVVLDLIFHWLPFLMVCFPVPGLRGKKANG